MKGLIKIVLAALGGAIVGSGTVAVIGQSQKNKLRNETKRAQDIAGRTVHAAEKLQEENERLKRQGK